MPSEPSTKQGRFDFIDATVKAHRAAVQRTQVMSSGRQLSYDELVDATRALGESAYWRDLANLLTSLMAKAPSQDVGAGAVLTALGAQGDRRDTTVFLSTAYATAAGDILKRLNRESASEGHTGVGPVLVKFTHSMDGVCEAHQQAVAYAAQHLGMVSL